MAENEDNNKSEAEMKKYLPGNPYSGRQGRIRNRRIIRSHIR